MPRGSCNCGAVRFETKGKLHPADACHCVQCRKQSGHYWVSTGVARDELTIDGADKLTWYQSSDKVRRGFCKVCGAFLFWDPPAMKGIGIAMGAFDESTGLKLAMHIFTAEKGDYYDIAGSAPQYAHWPEKKG